MVIFYSREIYHEAGSRNVFISPSYFLRSVGAVSEMWIVKYHKSEVHLRGDTIFYMSSSAEEGEKRKENITRSPLSLLLSFHSFHFFYTGETHSLGSLPHSPLTQQFLLYISSPSSSFRFFSLVSLARPALLSFD